MENLNKNALIYLHNRPNYRIKNLILNKTNDSIYMNIGDVSMKIPKISIPTDFTKNISIKIDSNEFSIIKNKTEIIVKLKEKQKVEELLFTIEDIEYFYELVNYMKFVNDYVFILFKYKDIIINIENTSSLLRKSRDLRIVLKKTKEDLYALEKFLKYYKENVDNKKIACSDKSHLIELLKVEEFEFDYIKDLNNLI